MNFHSRNTNEGTIRCGHPRCRSQWFGRGSYLTRAGLTVLLLEKNDYIGGATTSQKVFPDFDAWLSRYSYLVSLFPEKIIRDLGLDLELRRRAIASYTPYFREWPPQRLASE